LKFLQFCRTNILFLQFCQKKKKRSLRDLNCAQVINLLLGRISAGILIEINSDCGVEKMIAAIRVGVAD
jgi:hypothetical protein